MLTYADVQRIYRLEKHSTLLERIPDNFYDEVKVLLSQIGEEHRTYIKKLVREIHERRKQKILFQAIRGGEVPVNVTPDEKNMYLEIVSRIEHYERGIFSADTSVSLDYEVEKKQEELIEDKQPTVQENSVILSEDEEENDSEEEEKNDVKLRILTSFPAIAGYNSLSYGPFEENQEVSLPRNIAKILVQREVAVAI